MNWGSLRERLRGLSHLWLPGLVVPGFLCAWGYKPAPLQTLRREYFDALDRARPRPHTVVASLLDRLRELGASVTVILPLRAPRAA